MCSIFHASRGGVRGGRDQFDWQSVKSDKDRECYLGHSVKASVGRWQEGKDLMWYTKQRSEALLESSEFREAKKLEDMALKNALGICITDFPCEDANVKENNQETSKTQKHQEGEKDWNSLLGYLLKRFGYKKLKAVMKEKRSLSTNINAGHSLCAQWTEKSTDSTENSDIHSRNNEINELSHSNRKIKNSTRKRTDSSDSSTFSNETGAKFYKNLNYKSLTTHKLNRRYSCESSADSITSNKSSYKPHIKRNHKTQKSHKRVRSESSNTSSNENIQRSRTKIKSTTNHKRNRHNFDSSDSSTDLGKTRTSRKHKSTTIYKYHNFHKSPSNENLYKSSKSRKHSLVKNTRY